jgi:hypothetical protein
MSETETDLKMSDYLFLAFSAARDLQRKVHALKPKPIGPVNKYGATVDFGNGTHWGESPDTD